MLCQYIGNMANSMSVMFVHSYTTYNSVIDGCWWKTFFYMYIPCFVYTHCHMSWLIFRVSMNCVSFIPICLHRVTHWRRDKMAAIFQTTFSNTFSRMKNVWISIRISLKFVKKCEINTILALRLIMAWYLTGTNPLSEPTWINLLTHICVI